MENLLYIFLLIHPATNADRIFAYWKKDKVLGDYPRPPKKELRIIVSSIKIEIAESIRII